VGLIERAGLKLRHGEWPGHARGSAREARKKG
jgi:hypothetical protein